MYASQWYLFEVSIGDQSNTWVDVSIESENYDYYNYGHGNPAGTICGDYTGTVYIIISASDYTGPFVLNIQQVDPLQHYNWTNAMPVSVGQSRNY